jgi:acyl-CoA synthetase (AMP-forming)/AMP-acid ligase II
MAGTVVDRLRERMPAFASSVALVDGGARWTYAELFDRVDRLSAALAGLGLHQGDAVLAFLPNCHQAVECELAALQSGLAWITLTLRLTWAEVRGVVASCAPKLLVTTPDGARKIALGLRALPLAPLPLMVLTDGDERAETLVAATSYEALLASHAPARPDVQIGGEDVARLRYTSGTTGGAKAAVLPHRVYHASLDNLLHELHPVTGSDRALHVAPLTHGSGALVYPILFAGGTNVLLQHFDVDATLLSIEHECITMLFTVPTMLSRLVASPGFDDRDLSHLRALIYGGAPMPEAQLRAATAKIGRALYQIYGMTEAPWPITILGPSEHRAGGARLRSVGRPTTVCEVRIADPEGRALGPDEVGEIQIRGKNVMSGYLADVEGTRAVLKDGWLASGDVGKKDADGFVFIVGRQKDVIISGGFNVYAAEVEAALSAHAGVLETAVVGLPHDDWGEMVVAYVVPRAGVSLTPAELHALVRAQLSGYKCPRRIEIVGDLPKNASGKIQKSEILRRAGLTEQ